VQKIGSVKDHLGSALDKKSFQPRKWSIYRVAKKTGISKSKRPVRQQQAFYLDPHGGARCAN